MNHAVIVENLSKQYTVYHQQKPSTFMELFLSGLKKNKVKDKFWALKDINLQVSFGEMVGIMGQNGSGKSTLLRLIGRVGKPDRGIIKTNGRLRALLELGAGFHTDLTGRENIFVAGIVAGLTKKEVVNRFDTIVQFAQLEAFIDNPVRTYSSGMKMRLGFSVAIHTQPQILLVDEHISVGDTKFKERCEDKISQLKNDGCAIIYVSQSPQQIQKICDRALWLNKGIPMSYGDAQDVGSQYLTHIHNQKIKENQQLEQHQTPVSIIDLKINPDSEIETGSPLNLEVEYLVHQQIDNFAIRIIIVNDEGQICFATSRWRTDWAQKAFQQKETMKVDIERLDLSQGKYFINLSILEPETHYIYDRLQNKYTLTISSDTQTVGIINPPCSWQLK